MLLSKDMVSKDTMAPTLKERGDISVAEIGYHMVVKILRFLKIQNKHFFPIFSDHIFFLTFFETERIILFLNYSISTFFSERMVFNSFGILPDFSLTSWQSWIRDFRIYSTGQKYGLTFFRFLKLL